MELPRRLEKFGRGGWSWRALLAAALVLACSGQVGGPAVAYAKGPDAYDEGSVTINAIQGNVSNRYRIYQVFKADIDDADNATHVTWGGSVTNSRNTTKEAVLDFLKTNGYQAWLDAKGYFKDAPEGVAYNNAQNAAEFISEKVGASADDDGAATAPPTKQAKTFALGLATTLANSRATPEVLPEELVDANGSATYANVEGYYLVVSNPDDISDYEAATSPIWLALGGSVKSITEKASLPSVDKTVRGVGDAAYSHATDAFHGQDIDYKLEGTLPDNIKTFEKYYLKFTDTLDNIELASADTSSVKVKVGSVDVTGKAKVAYASDTLTVEIEDLMALGVANLNKAMKVTVDYRAHVKNTAERSLSAGAADGGSNKVYLEYTNNPVLDKDGKSPTGKTPESQAKTYSYRANVVKVDKTNKQELAGARFTVALESYNGSVAGANDESGAFVGKYVQADGSLGDVPFEFVSAADGTFSVPGLDAGTYRIRETRAPSGYELQDADIVLAISPSFDSARTALASFDATVSGGEAASDVEGAGADWTTAKMSVDKTAGSIEIRAANDKTFVLANTGLEGIGAYMAVAAALMLAGMAGLFATRRGEASAEDALRGV